MGLTWAIGWAFAGLLIGAGSVLLPGLPWNAFFEVFDAPLPALAIPGFIAGMFFSTVLGVAGRRRSFDELSLTRFAAWGAAGGLLLTLFPFALVAVGLASREGSHVGTGQILAVTGVRVLGRVHGAHGLPDLGHAPAGERVAEHARLLLLGRDDRGGTGGHQRK